MGSVEQQQHLLVEMVMRQTNYSFDEAKTNLKNSNNDYMKVIREAIGVAPKNTAPVTTINQGIYKEIRCLMDTAAATHRRKKEFDEKKEQLIAHLKKQKEEKDKEKLEDLEIQLEIIRLHQSRIRHLPLDLGLEEDHCRGHNRWFRLRHDEG